MIMNKKTSLFLLRVTLGVYYLYAGLSKVFNSEWSAASFLNGAENFPGMFAWFASDGNIAWVNFLNEWGLTLLGVALILGLFMRWAVIGGTILMILYYLTSIDFPYVDNHIIYIAALWVLLKLDAGKYWGLGK